MPWRWAWAGALIGLALTLLAQAPARWLAATVERASGQVVQLADPQGTLWNGSARLLLSGGAGSRSLTALPGRVRWTLRPAWGGLQARVRADCCTPAGPLIMRVRPRWGGAQMQVADGQTLWPAALLAGLGTPMNTIEPQGELTLSTQGLSVEWLAGRLLLQGRAEFTARHMTSRLSTVAPLGSYRMALTGGDAPTLELSTLEGALQLSGSGQWAGQRLRFTGEAWAAPGMQAPLGNLLSLLGRMQGGRAQISLG
ncbi:MAG: type II secretion system protein N [Burkholderiaceae bacterium]|nr:type II secretion system protein N [Burkholderiaceae bacterium]